MPDINDKIPAFLREFLQTQYPNDAERIEAGYGTRRPVTLRANRLKATREDVRAALLQGGIASEEISWYEDALLLPSAREEEIAKTSLYLEGKIYLQSLSSMLPPLYLRPAAGENILDMAAAPGGKTTQICALSGGAALVTACERDKIRFERLRFNLARQGAGRVNAMCADARKLSDFLRFDKVLLDAPCSGSGTVSLFAPSAMSEKLVQNCVKMQAELLQKGLKLLKEGGILVYSTCSVLKQENEGILAKLPRGYELLPLRAPEEARLLPGAEGTITVCPDERFEGFFVAAIKKTARK